MTLRDIYNYVWHIELYSITKNINIFSTTLWYYL